MKLKSIAAWAAAAWLVSINASAEPQPAPHYPSRTVTVLAPFAAGGTSDIVARLISQKLTAQFGQTFVVDNRGGAGGTIATGMLAHAAPDGYTLMVHHMGLAFNAGLYDKLPYDPERDVLPIAYIGATPNVLVVPKALPIHNAAEFLAYAKSHPGRLNYGSGGVGSSGHVPMELLSVMTGVSLTHVPYKGAGPAAVDLVSGQIQAMLQTIPAVMPFIQQGKLRALATSGARRTPVLPDVPTLQEAGVRGFDYAPWYGLFAPRDTPPALVARLHDALNQALQDPQIADKLAQQGLEVQAMTQPQFAALVARDTAAWSKRIRDFGLRAD
jgi:tripartite-type tricarboxylate transporter receptor subunit TctC